MYTVGDRVVYPMHGAGEITAIDTKEVEGEKEEYLDIEFNGGLRLLVPVKNVENVGLRDLSDVEDLKKVYDILSENMTEMSSNWNKRYRDNMEHIKSGDIFRVAGVVRNLMILDYQKPLSTGERKLLNSAKNMLTSEIMMITNQTQEEVDKDLEEVIRFED